MDSLNFLNTIYFIRDYIRGLFTEVQEVVEEPSEYTSIDDAISYFKTDPQGLLNELMSSDISLITVVVVENDLRTYTATLRNATNILKSGRNLPSFIQVKNDPVYLRDFLINGSGSDLRTSLETFFISAAGFLKAYKGVGYSEVNHRLASSLSANVIHLKEVFAGLQFVASEEI